MLLATISPVMSTTDLMRIWRAFPSLTLMSRFHWRFLGLAWLTLWTVMLPLFHIHVPDSTDRWSRLQSGGAHSVFTLIFQVSIPFPFEIAKQDRRATCRCESSIPLNLALPSSVTPMIARSNQYLV